MRRLRFVFYSAIILLFSLSALSSPLASQVSQYSKDGLSFNYPSDWPLQEESNEQVLIASLDPGQNEAKIMVMAFRQTMAPQQIEQVQPNVTESLADSFTQAIQQQGGLVQRSSTNVTAAGLPASGLRLRAVIRNDPGNAEIDWLTLNNHLIYLIFVGSDTEREHAAVAWNMVCTTLRFGGSASPESSPIPTEHIDLSSYTYLKVLGKSPFSFSRSPTASEREPRLILQKINIPGE